MPRGTELRIERIGLRVVLLRDPVVHGGRAEAARLALDLRASFGDHRHVQVGVHDLFLFDVLKAHERSLPMFMPASYETDNREYITGYEGTPQLVHICKSAWSTEVFQALIAQAASARICGDPRRGRT